MSPISPVPGVFCPDRTASIRSSPRITRCRSRACSRWPIDWSFCYIGRPNVEKGLAANYGQKNLSYSVFYPDSPRGEQVLAYTAVDDVYADMADFLSTDRENDVSPVSSDVSSITFEHIETKTSLDGVLHGNNSRS